MRILKLKGRKGRIAIFKTLPTSKMFKTLPTSNIFKTLPTSKMYLKFC